MCIGSAFCSFQPKLPKALPSIFENDENPFQDEFHWGELIGKGGYSNVFKCTRIKDDQIMACKVIHPKEGRSPKKMKEEINLMKKMVGKHPAFLKLYDYRSHENKLYVFMEICLGGDLSANRDRLSSEEDVQRILGQLVSALVYIHSKKLVHSDLKLQNIAFLDREGLRIKLLDFGLSKLQRRGKKVTGRRGTFSYMAPEVAKKQGYTEMADMWSVGAMLYKMLVKKPFLYQKEVLDDKLVTSQIRELLMKPEGVSEEAHDLMKRLLVIHPPDRLTAREALMHPFLAKGQDDVFNRKVMQSLDFFLRRGKVQDALLPLMMAYYEERNQDLMKNFSQDEVNADQFLEIWGNIAMGDATNAIPIFKQLDYDNTGRIYSWQILLWFAFEYVMGHDERLIELIETKLAPGCENFGWEIVDKALKENWVESDAYLEDLKEMFDDEPCNAEDFAWMISADYAPPINEKLTSTIWETVRSSFSRCRSASAHNPNGANNLEKPRSRKKLNESSPLQSS